MSQSMQKPCRPLIPLALAAGVWFTPLYVCAADTDTSLKRPEITSRKMYIPDAYRDSEAYRAPIDASPEELENARVETIRPNKSRASNATANTSTQYNTPQDAAASEPYSAENSAQWRARYADQVRKKIAQKLAGHQAQTHTLSQATPVQKQAMQQTAPAISQDISRVQPSIHSEEPTHPEAPQVATINTAPLPTSDISAPIKKNDEPDASLTQVLSQVKAVAATPSTPVNTPKAGVSEGLLAPAAGQSPQSPTPAALSTQAAVLVPPTLPQQLAPEKKSAPKADAPSVTATSPQQPTPLMPSPFANQIATSSSAKPTDSTTPPAVIAPSTPSNAPLNPELADLSLAARGILESLPSDLTGLKQRKDPWKDVSIARQNPDIKIPDAKDKQAGKTGTKNASRRSYDANYELERAYQSLIAGDTESAVGIYQDVLSNEPNNETALFGLATTWQRLGNLDKAAPLYGQLLMQNPHNVEVLNNFLALVAEESPQVALQQMERLAQRNPEFSPIFAQLALLYKRLNNFPKAIENMGKAIAVSPENLAYKYNLAILYDQADDKDNAMRVYRQLVRAHNMGQELPASIKSIQERLTFLASNTK